MMRTRHAVTAEGAFAAHEHDELSAGIDRIHRVACIAATITPVALSNHLLEIQNWVATTLDPHATWEDAHLYGRIDRAAGSPWATKLVRFEHVQIRDVAKRLQADLQLLQVNAGPHQRVEAAGHLFALEALLRAHIERERIMLLPLLEESEGQLRPEVAAQ